jgi:hypothetical protein
MSSITKRHAVKYKEHISKGCCVCLAGVKPGEVQVGAGARGLSLQLPPALESSTLGALVQCQYRLVVRLKV